MGRPSDYSLELAVTLCARIVDGESLRAICRDEDMPNKSTVFRWLAEDKSFCDLYEKSRESQADSLADDLLEIADNQGDVQRDRLRVDTRKWIAAKLKPRKYGDKIENTHLGPGGGPVMISNVDGEL